MPLAAAIVLFALVGAVAFASLRKGAATSDLSEACRTIQRRIATLPWDADPGTRAQLEAELRNCAADLAARGIDIDFSTIALGNARNTGQQIESLWSDYRGTDYGDTVKRDNTRRAMMRLLDQLVTTLREAAATATTPAQKTAARDEILTQIGKSIDRAYCLNTGGAGCGRFGVVEPDWDERARDELTHGAFALGLRAAQENGYRTPRDRGEPRDSDPHWRNWFLARTSGNYPAEGLFRIGELGPLVDPSWDTFGGGPHYAGQTLAIRAAWDAPQDVPYSLVPVHRISARDVSRAIGGSRGLFVPFRIT